MITHCRAILLVVAWMIPSLPAMAHPILIHSGTIQWTDQSLQITLNLDPHAITHETMPLASSATTEEIARSLINSIHITTHEAETAEPSRVELNQDASSITGEYKINKEENVLVLVHQPTDNLAPMSRQIQFIQNLPGNSTRLIRLTSAGNPEVIHRKTRQAHPIAGFDPLTEPIIRITQQPKQNRITLQIDYPVTLLTTWPDLVQTRDESISLESFNKTIPILRQWSLNNLCMNEEKKGSTQTHIESITLIAPDDCPIQTKSPQRFSTNTTRVRWTLHIDNTKVETPQELKWTGFNAAILSIPTIQHTPGNPPAPKLLTSTQNKITNQSPR